MTSHYVYRYFDAAGNHPTAPRCAECRSRHKREHYASRRDNAA